jgi:hypothetical protein
MKYTIVLAMGSVIGGLVGCASPSPMAVSEAVGPAPAGGEASRGSSALQVYSARLRSPVDLNREEFLANNDFGKNDLVYRPAHTDYTIYSQDGKLVREVHNAWGPNDPEPTVVPLSPGRYTVQARARGYGVVSVPVVIEAGKLTTVNLQRYRKPVPESAPRTELVLLGHNRVVGWKATATTPAENR